MDRNLLDGSMGSYLKYLTGLSALQKLSMAYMYFSGQFPSFILDSTSLTSLDISTNYLTGSLPPTITKIKSLKFDSNYFVGSLPSAPWTTCGCTSNCLSSAGTCGGSNMADAMMALKAALGVTLTTWASTTPCRVTGLLTPLTNEWTGVLCNPAGSVESILKGSLPSDISKLTALTYLNYSLIHRLPATAHHTVSQTQMHAEALLLAFPPLFPGYPHVSHMSLVSLACLSCLLVLPPLAPSPFHAPPSAPAQHPSSTPTSRPLPPRGLFSNYLTGTMPIPSTSLASLDVGFNYLSGSFPKLSLAVCAADQNCFLNSSYCRTYGSLQRPASACGICGTTNGQGTLCSGGLCSANSSLPVSQGIVNTPSVPLVSLTCSGYRPTVLMNPASGGPNANTHPCPSHCLPALSVIPVRDAIHQVIPGFDAHKLGFLLSLPCGQRTYAARDNLLVSVDTGAGAAVIFHRQGMETYLLVPQHVLLFFPSLLSLKASLGLTFTSWAASVPCQVVGKQAAAQPTWSGVLCSDAGDVFSISVARQNLTGSIDSDISKLTALTYLGLFSNYFTGTMPTLSTSLVALDVRFNFLSGSFPQLSLKSCAADQNCFLNSSYCRTYGALQRLSSACAICGTTNGQGTLCSGGMCFADSYLPVSQGIVNVPSLPPVALTCPGNAPLVLMNAASVSTMLPIKSSLGLTSTTWDASLLCVAGFGNTPFGVTTWDRVLCSVGGSPLLLNFNILSLKVATLPADMSKLTGLTNLANFLTGSIPAMGTALKSLYIAYNYITNVATHSLTTCAGSMCCLSNPSKCASDETTQRPAAECAICGTTNAVAPFCWGAGGECVVAAADNIAAGKRNIVYLPPAPPMVCSALLSLKASLGVTFTSWAASVPCQVVGKQAAGLPTWSGVLCGDTGDVIYM
ncbi:unnamed protein product [Closterium sp. Naga37s-1]|nr:unnamed protein product [Closterium sp. Naga37s-1]